MIDQYLKASFDKMSTSLLIPHLSSISHTKSIFFLKVQQIEVQPQFDLAAAVTAQLDRQVK